MRGPAWEEFNLKGAEWRIPATRMKMRELHVVPPSTQAVALLTDLHTLTGKGHYLFPSIRSKDRPVSHSTINAALRRLGFSADEMVAHGFRSTASTCLNELGWHPDLIELQLAHAERNESRGAYNRAQRLGSGSQNERRKVRRRLSSARKTTFATSHERRLRESVTCAVPFRGVGNGRYSVRMHHGCERRLRCRAF